MAGLMALTGATSLVVATISVWLVPVYMAAMVLIFAAPRPQKAVESASSLPSPDVFKPASPEVVAGAVADEAAAAENVEPPAPVEPAAEPTSPKPRKKRGKGKRAAKAAAQAEASSSQPTWIRVGPGKFVRADVQAEPPAESENPTESESAIPTDPESTSGREAVDPQTLTEATPAEARGEEFGETSPGESTAPSEAAPTEADEEYGNAPSALDETWESEALPEAFADDGPAPAVEGDRRDDVPEEAVFEERSGTPAAHEGPPSAIASKPPGRSTPAGVPTISLMTSARPVGLDANRKPSPLRERPDRARNHRPRNTSTRPIPSNRTVRVRPRASDRGRSRTDPTGRRYHSRSPPRRA